MVYKYNYERNARSRLKTYPIRNVIPNFEVLFLNQCQEKNVLCPQSVLFCRVCFAGRIFASNTIGSRFLFIFDAYSCVRLIQQIYAHRKIITLTRNIYTHTVCETVGSLLLNVYKC